MLGIGGSASTDGGAGLLQALGATLRDQGGEELRPGGACLSQLAHIDLSGLHPRLPGVELVVAWEWTTP